VLLMITSAIAPYCYDVSVIVGLPTNLSHRFRYRGKWVKLDRNIETVVGEEALIILRVQDTGDLIPVRFVLIENVRRIGDISFIEFHTLELCSVKTIHRASELVNKALRTRGYANIAGQDLESLVLELEPRDAQELENLKTDNEDEQWAEVVRKLGTLDCFRDFSFLRVLDMRDARGKTAPMKRGESGQYSFSLDPDRVYFLNVMQHVPWKIEETERIEKSYDVELDAETDEIVVLRKIQRVVGKYDLLRFIFKTPLAYETKHTYLELNNKQGVPLSEFSLPVLFLPLFIHLSGWRRRLIWVRRFAAVIASLGIIASAPLSRLLCIPTEWIWLVSLLVLVVSTNKADEFASAIVGDIQRSQLR
jgi:hypothetical protein